MKCIMFYYEYLRFSCVFSQQIAGSNKYRQQLIIWEFESREFYSVHRQCVSLVANSVNSALYVHKYIIVTPQTVW